MMMDSNTGWSHSSVYTFGFGLLVLYNVLKQCHHSLSYSLRSLLSLKTGKRQRQKAEYMMASNMVAVTVIVPQQVFKAIHFLLLVFFIFLATKLKRWVDQKGHSPIKKQELRQHLMQTVKLLSFLPKIWHSSLPQICGEAPSATISLKGPSSFTTLTWGTQVRFSELIWV